MWLRKSKWYERRMNEMKNIQLRITFLRTDLKEFLDVWADKNSTEMDLLPILAASLSPSNCALASFDEKIKLNARNFFKKLLDEMDQDEEMDVEGVANVQDKPVETLDVMARYY